MVDSLFACLVYNLYTLGLGPVLLIYLLLAYKKKIKNQEDPMKLALALMELRYCKH